MSIDNAIACIDIWSSKIRTLIGHFDSVDKWHLNVLWVWISDSLAIRKWNILDMEEFKSNLDKSLEEAEKMAWEQVSWVFLSFNSSSMEVLDSKWIIAVSWDQIEISDIDRVLDMAKNGISLPNREILKVIPDSYVVDLEDGIKSPIWMAARKLEVRANIFSISTNVLNNIKKAVEDIWVEVYDVFPNLISSPEWVLSKRQKELWVVCIDIWASTTWITLYEEGSLKFSKIIPIGWDSVTNDIALWLRTSIDIAEKLKLEFWILWLDKIENYTDIDIDLSKISKTESQVVSNLYLSKIIQARYEEIIFFVKDELKKIWRDWMLPEWAVIVWWWSKMRWLVDLSKEMLRLPVIIWIPVNDSVLAETSISDPSFSSVMWSIILANKYTDSRSVLSLNISWIFSSFWKVLKKMLPK